MYLRPTYRQFTVIVLLCITVFLSCSKKPTDDNKGNSDPAVLSVIPANAAPGVVLSVSGFNIDTTQITSYTIFIGGQQSLVITDTSGVVSTIAPMFFDDTLDTWPTPPAGALDIEIYLDTTLVAVGRNIFTVDSLVPAPGATQQLVQNTIATVESYKTILTALTTEAGLFEQMVFGITEGLDSLMYSDNDSTLTALLTELQTTDPNAVALLDATFNSSGAVEQSREFANALQNIVDSISIGNLKSSSAAINDVNLAVMMQLSTVFKDFGETYISGVAASASNVSFIGGWLGFVAQLNPLIAGARALFSFLSLQTSLVNLIFNKIIVASLPTRIDSLTITLASDTISTGDTTNSILTIYSSNNPPNITMGDLVGQFLSIAGLFVPGAQTLKDRLLRTLNFIIGKIKTALSSYHSSHPEFEYDPAIFDLFSIPIIKWETEIQDPRLLELHSTVPSKLQPSDSLLEWYSPGDFGSSNISITPARGPELVLIPIPPFIEYNGTAFGILGASSAFSSEPTEVTILPDLALEVDFATTIAREGVNALGVRAGRISILGDTTWTDGLNVTLTVIGGGADPSIGTTDANGQFVSLISLDPFSDTVKVEVRVTHSLGGFVAAEVMATTQTDTGGTFTASVRGSIISISSDGQVIDTILTNPNIDGSSYNWSPDGTKILIGAKFILGLDGSELQLANVGTTNWATWSPDGKYLYKSDRIQSSIVDSSIIRVIPTDGSAITNLYSVDDSEPSIRVRKFRQPAISHDGNSIAIMIEEGMTSENVVTSGISNSFILRIVNTTTGATTDVITINEPWGNGVYNNVSAGGAGPGASPTWSPDDSKIIIGYNWSDTSGYKKNGLYTVDVASGSMTRVSPLTPSTEFYSLINPEFLPNNTEILFIRQLSSYPVASPYELMITNIFSSSIQITFNTTETPVFSSVTMSGDGSKFAVIYNFNSLKIFNKDGSVSGILPNQPFISSIRWKP